MFRLGLLPVGKEPFPLIIPLSNKPVGFRCPRMIWSIIGNGGFSVTGTGPWDVTVPSYRSEVERPIDLVEEYLRLRGTEDLTGTQLHFPANERGK